MCFGYGVLGVERENSRVRATHVYYLARVKNRVGLFLMQVLLVFKKRSDLHSLEK